MHHRKIRWAKAFAGSFVSGREKYVDGRYPLKVAILPGVIRLGDPGAGRHPEGKGQPFPRRAYNKEKVFV